ncbi:MAG: hypothetical protein WA853_20355, partial [Candidatus Acidiferrum sp.]
MKNKKRGKNDATEACGIIPFNFLAKVKNGERRKDGERDDLLNRLELGSGEFVRADTVRRNLKTVLEEGNAPTHKNNFPESGRAELQMAIPGKGHENVRYREKDDGSQRGYLLDGNRSPGCDGFLPTGLKNERRRSGGCCFSALIPDTAHLYHETVQSTQKGSLKLPKTENLASL